MKKISMKRKMKNIKRRMRVSEIILKLIQISLTLLFLNKIFIQALLVP